MYVGLWKNGCFHGKGLFYMKSNNRWQLADFENGSMIRVLSSGDGKPSSLTIRSKCGGSASQLKDLAEETWEGELYFDHYQGDIMNGMRDGNGTFTFADGSFYTGMWKSNKPSGIGLFHYTDGKYDVGVYLDGFLNSYGRAQYSNGDIYEGYFKKGDMCGMGLYYQKDDSSYIFGNFQNNKLMEVTKKYENYASGTLNFRKLEREYMQMLIRKSTPKKQLESLDLKTVSPSGEKIDMPIQNMPEIKDQEMEKIKKSLNFAGNEEEKIGSEVKKNDNEKIIKEGELNENENKDERIHTIHDFIAGCAPKSCKTNEIKDDKIEENKGCIIL